VRLNVTVVGHGEGALEDGTAFLEHRGVDPDSKDKGSRTLLSLASENGHEAVVKLLLAIDSISPDSQDTTIRRRCRWPQRKGMRRWLDSSRAQIRRIGFKDLR